MIDDERVVLVVTRVGAQFWRALIQIADLQVLAVPEPATEGQQRQHK